MYKYPSISEAKAHAKYIARTLNLKLTEAQEVVAYIYSCYDWAELKSKQNCSGNIEHLIDVDPIKYIHTVNPFRYHKDELEVNELDDLLDTHINTLKQYLNSSNLAPGSLLERLTNKNYSQISGQVVSQVLEDLREDESQGFNAKDSDQIIECIMLCDDTINKVLYQKESISPINTHLEPKAYRQRFYAYYTFENNEVYISSREWDLEVFRPSKYEQQFSGELLSRSVCSRKWFIDYMIGYVKLIVHQFQMAGYSGKIRICRIQNADVSNFYHNKTDRFSHKGLDKLFTALLELGGSYVWETGTDGFRYNFGIEIPFTKEAKCTSSI